MAHSTCPAELLQVSCMYIIKVEVEWASVQLTQHCSTCVISLFLAPGISHAVVVMMTRWIASLVAVVNQSRCSLPASEHSECGQHRNVGKLLITQWMNVTCRLFRVSQEADANQFIEIRDGVWGVAGTELWRPMYRVLRRRDEVRRWMRHRMGSLPVQLQSLWPDRLQHVTARLRRKFWVSVWRRVDK